MADAALDLQVGTEKNVKDLQIAVGRNSRRVVIEIDRSETPYEEYSGPYEVTPQFYYGTTLETNKKRMIDNVTVYPIPVASVSNPAGGRTVTIG